MSLAILVACGYHSLIANSRCEKPSVDRLAALIDKASDRTQDTQVRRAALADIAAMGARTAGADISIPWILPILPDKDLSDMVVVALVALVTDRSFPTVQRYFCSHPEVMDLLIEYIRDQSSGRGGTLIGTRVIAATQIFSRKPYHRILAYDILANQFYCTTPYGLLYYAAIFDPDPQVAYNALRWIHMYGHSSVISSTACEYLFRSAKSADDLSELISSVSPIAGRSRIACRIAKETLENDDMEDSVVIDALALASECGNRSVLLLPAVQNRTKSKNLEVRRHAEATLKQIKAQHGISP